MEESTMMRVSVIVITLNRPAYLARCIQCLLKQTQRPHEIIVVDSSSDDITSKLLAAQFPSVIYLRNESDRGNMPCSRNIGIKRASGDIMAFLDDDSFAEPQWLENIEAPYRDREVGAVGGRALNNQPGESTRGVNEIGKLHANGQIVHNFAANPGKVIDVDIIIGCNMSFRRDVLGQLGGFREYYGGSGSCEDTDICLRVKQLGYRLQFSPAACVEHVGAPQSKGRRFDLRYEFYGYRNFHIMLMVNYGLFSPRFWHPAAYHFYYGVIGEFVRKMGGALLRALSKPAGSICGVAIGGLLRLTRGGSPERRDKEGNEIRRLLGTGDAAPVRPPNGGAEPVLSRG